MHSVNIVVVRTFTHFIFIAVCTVPSRESGINGVIRILGARSVLFPDDTEKMGHIIFVL